MTSYQTLAHRAGCIRKKYKLTPYEAAYCVLWLMGEEESRIPELAQRMQEMRMKKERNAKWTD